MSLRAFNQSVNTRREGEVDSLSLQAAARTFGNRYRNSRVTGTLDASHHLTRFAAVLILVLMSPAEAWAQAESWKIFLRAAGTWSTPRGVEIDSTGTLVTHEGESGQMPRCAILTPGELDYLSKRVSEAKRYGDKSQRDWGTTLLDTDSAQLTIIWTGSDKILRVGMPLGTNLIEGSPPQFLVDLIQKGWRLRESAKSTCRP
jgi:hypothetical protein